MARWLLLLVIPIVFYVSVISGNANRFQFPLPWRVLVLIYSQTDAEFIRPSGQRDHLHASMTSAELSRAEQVVHLFFEADVRALTEGNLRPELTIHVSDQPLTQLTEFCGYYPSPHDTATYADPTYDSIVVIWDSSGTDATGAEVNLQPCGGVSIPNGREQTYSTLPVHTLTDDNYLILAEQWGQAVLWYFDASGVTPVPIVDVQVSSTDERYVNCVTGTSYPQITTSGSSGHNFSAFIHDYLSGQVASVAEPQRCLGASSTVWAFGGPASGPTALESEVSTNVLIDPTQVFGITGTHILRVGTYNVNEGYDEANRFRLNEIAETIEAAGANIILLQEARPEQSLWLAWRLQMWLRFLPTGHSKTGLAVLAHVPIVYSVTTPLTTMNQQIEAQHVVIALEEYELGLYNVEFGPDADEQQIQLDLLLQRIFNRDYAGQLDRARIIVGGTFNNIPGSPLIEQMRINGGFIDAFAGMADELAATMLIGNTHERFDYIWLSRTLTWSGVGVMPSNASIHRLLVVEIEL